MKNICYDGSNEANFVLLILVYFSTDMVKCKEVRLKTNIKLQTFWNRGSSMHDVADDNDDARCP